MNCRSISSRLHGTTSQKTCTCYRDNLKYIKTDIEGQCLRRIISTLKNRWKKRKCAREVLVGKPEEKKPFGIPSYT